jgi:uncharacterized low-complexity protein
LLGDKPARERTPSKTIVAWRSCRRAASFIARTSTVPEKSMKKLLAIAAMSSLVALTGCPRGNKDEKKVDPATKVVDKPGETKPGETKPGEMKAGETKPGEAKPDETKAETKPGEAKPDETKAETKPGEAKPEAKPVEKK